MCYKKHSTRHKPDGNSKGLGFRFGVFGRPDLAGRADKCSPNVMPDEVPGALFSAESAREVTFKSVTESAVSEDSEKKTHSCERLVQEVCHALDIIVCITLTLLTYSRVCLE